MSRSAEGNGDLDTLKDLEKDGASDLHTLVGLTQNAKVGQDGGEGHVGSRCAPASDVIPALKPFTV